MDISYNRMHADSFMIIEHDTCDSTFEDKMINENEIGCLLKMTKISLNGSTQYHYNISRKENIYDYVEVEGLSPKILEKIILNLHFALEELSKYLISTEHILLTNETIFVEGSGENLRLSLCYLPDNNGTLQEQFRLVLEKLLSLGSNAEEGNEIIYELYDMSLKDDYTLMELVDYIREKNVDSHMPYVEKVDLDESECAYEESEEEEFIEEMVEYPSQGKEGFFAAIANSLVRGVKRLRFNDYYEEEVHYEDFTVYPDEEIDERTVLLPRAEQQVQGRLVYDGDGMESSFLINKDVFKIGSSRKNDAVINSKAVSGIHAKIVRENGNYYLEDMNSLNGSYVGSHNLNYRDHIKLKAMDIVRFADVSYVFM
ncbi:MAG: FHA domain-containing protein [Pseudobutyrivibrio sp.]|nr:FHA domain-containing protein [Pseudobutyrivibrio sp.]